MARGLTLRSWLLDLILNLGGWECEVVLRVFDAFSFFCYKGGNIDIFWLAIHSNQANLKPAFLFWSWF
jgi:hypothetical protein